MSESRSRSTRTRTFLTSPVVVLVAAGLLIGAAAVRMTQSPTPSPTGVNSAPKPSPTSAAPDAMVSAAQESIATREYEASRNDRGLQAPNRAHNLRTYFEPWGVRVEDRTAEGSLELFRLKTASLGREGRLVELRAGEISMNGARVENRRGDGIVEWYENGEAGLEHGYVIDRSPAGEGALWIDVAFKGAAVSVAGGRAVIETSGGRRLEYSKLLVTDATGREISARLESASNESVRLCIDDDGAAYPILIDPLLTSTADATLQSNQTTAELGYSVAGAGDVNGDGYADVIVGARLYDAGEADEGAAFVFHGGLSGITSGNPGTANATLQSNQAGAQMGYAVSGAGDVNGDGYADVIVGVPSYSASQLNEGAAFVFHGGPSGITSGNPGTSSSTLQSDQISAGMGHSVAGAGDVNGDGYADVIVGASVFDSGQADEGAAFVFNGSSSGIANGNPTNAAAILQSDQVSGQLGMCVAGAGDVNGDGYADVIVGAYGYDAGQSEEGAAFVFLGSLTGIASSSPATANTTIQSNQAFAALGWNVSGAGDTNGDGYADVVVGAILFDASQVDGGAAFVFNGSPTGIPSGEPGTANATLESDQGSVEFGLTVAGLGDVNGDGYADVAVGARTYDAGQTDEGATFVFHGGPSGISSATSASANVTLQSDQAGARFGHCVDGAGDVNGDGYADLIVGARLFDAGQLDEGGAFVYLGGAEGVRNGDPANAHAVLQSDQESAYLGKSVAGAGDVNGDGYADVIVGAPEYDAGQPDEGAAFVLLGGPSGISGGTPSTASAMIQSDQAGARIGQCLAGAGDVNGDGYADIIVGANLYSAGQSLEGAAFVFHGGPSGIDSGSPATANTILQSDLVQSSFGFCVAGAGDVNGDGYADVIVGAPIFDAGQFEEGAAFVFQGGPFGITGGTLATANAVLQSDQADSRLGRSVAGAGDVNGDGYADVIVGAVSYDVGQMNEGAAFVFHGGPSGIASGSPTTANATLQSDQEGGNLGVSVSGAGDVNGDGYADVIVGSTGYDTGQLQEGAAFVFHGGPSGIPNGTPATANATLQSDQGSANLGSPVAGAGDVNGDGYADVIVAASRYDSGETDEGVAFVFLGSPSGITNGTPATASATLQSNQVDSWFGEGVAGAGDVNGDGFADVIAGAQLYDAGQTNEGAAFVFFGNGDGLGRSNRTQQLRGSGNTTNVEPWGSSIAGDFQVRMVATHPGGRGRVKLQIESCPAGENWGGSNCVTVTSSTWADVTATSAGVVLTESVSGLNPNSLYRWRARILFAPFTFLTEPPSSAHGPWRRLRGQAIEADIRTGCTITCPANITSSNDVGMCGSVVNYPAPSTTGMCGPVTCLPASGSFFAVGTTTVNCTTTSGPACSFSVTVNDTQSPVVTCPGPIVVGNSTGLCSAVVTFTAMASDNCPGAIVACVPPSGASFPVGATMVTCTATDVSANAGTCSFTVTVNDTESPTLTCPAPITAGNTPGQCSAVVNFAVTASDNCSGVTLACVPASGAAFPLGVTMVTCTATDAALNTGMCSFSVTVNDTQAPIANCPAPITVGNAPGQCSAVVNFMATASDNCAVASVVCVPASGSTFPVGTTMVTCTATDVALNTGVCSFSVTVNDNEVMAIACPANIQTVAATPAGRIVSYSVPVATDNCGATVTCLPASGSTFAIGTTTVTCTATDAANNSTNCQFTVEVAPLGTDTAGIYVAATGSWFLRNANSPGAADLVFGYGPAGLGWIALRGDWDGNGSDTAGLYDPANGNFFLKNTNAAGGADLVYGFGPAGFGWQPLVGDWDGDGVDTIGLYDPSSGFFFLRNSHAPGAADMVYGFGPAGTGWTPMQGDWDGNGTDTVGLYDPATGNFFLRNAHAAGGADLVYGFGPAGLGWKPLAGDWNGDGLDTIGLYSPTNGFFFLRNFHAPGAADVVFGYGPANTTPVLGDWNGL